MKKPLRMVGTALLCLALAAALPTAPSSAQTPAQTPEDPQGEPAAAAAAEPQQAAATPEPGRPAVDTRTKYEDFTVKGYSLSVFGGAFSGARYLDNKATAERTILTLGAADILAFNPNGPLAIEDGVLFYSRDTVHYNAARKEIDPGSAFGGRLGVYLSDDFHLDLTGTYASGKAVTSMIYMEDPEDPSTYVRKDLDFDDGFKVYMGGLALTYDARPAEVLGVVPTLGFGLGGVINRYTYLEDKTGLYLDGSLGLTSRIRRNLDVVAQLDVTMFAFDVDELGYSNMVSYKTFSLGLSWFIDVLPPQVRAAHQASLRN